MCAARRTKIQHTKAESAGKTGEEHGRQLMGTIQEDRKLAWLRDAKSRAESKTWSKRPSVITDGDDL